VARLGDVRPDRGGVRLATVVPMTGVIATLAAVAVIATLMVIGIRMKLPPPDPDWRQQSHHRPRLRRVGGKPSG
jgi:hypothetical protein